MTDLRRSMPTNTDAARLHRKQQPQTQTYCDAFRTSCNTTPEPKPHATAAPVASALTNGHGRNPLLQSLAKHASLGSMGSGGSTTSSTATTATAPTFGRQCNGGAHTDIQFDEREIYYVSPSKRKSALQQQQQLPLRSSLRACERLRSFSPTAAATVAPSYPALTPSAAYGARTAGGAHDLSFDSYEISSHFSDTAMQMLRSGSCSGGVGGGVGNLMTSATAGSSSSNSSLLAAQHALPAQRSQNNVTFSNYVSEQLVAPQQQQQSRGSLRRSKGRSNQSLCSCDAGAETEINPDPARPLYQYSLERRHKGHTYTCEQNAQILMRLERERNRKLSLTGGGGSGGCDGGESDGKEELQSDTPSSSDVDAIPPVPPPPSMKRNGSMRSLRLIQQHHQQQQQQQQQYKRPATSGNANKLRSGNGNCNGSDILNDCTNSVLDVGSVIDDCTTSILKCANAVGAEIMAATTAGATHKAAIGNATLATMATQHAKPDVCHVGNTITSFSNYPPPTDITSSCISDDIFMPNSKKSDPTMCFLHGIGQSSALDTPSNKRSTLSLSKYNTIGPSSDYARQLSQYSQQMQRQKQRIATNRCRCFSQSLSNFSRDYFGQQHQQQQQQQQQHRNSLRRSGDDDNHAKHHTIFHTSGGGGGGDELDWISARPPINSRSYSNLVDIDGRHSFYHNFPHPLNGAAATDDDAAAADANVFSSSCGYGNLLNNASSFTTLSSSANSGLKEKLQQLQQHHHHQQHHHDHHHLLHSHQPAMHQQHIQQQQQQHHRSHQQQQSSAAASSAAAAAASQQSQKHHQLHSSVTSIMPWKHRQCPSRGSSSSGTNSFRFDAAKHWLAVSSILLIIGAASVAVPLALRVAASAPFEERLRVAVQLLDQVPLIDGHNDLPWNIRKFLHNKLNDFKFDEDLRNVMPWERSHWSHTDLQRLKKGRISAQFWAAYVPCEAQHRDAVQLTLEQIDVIKRLTDRYSPQLTTCTSSEDIIEAHKNHQLCSLTGVEGGHSLGGSLAVLRTLYAIGVRYMTLTSTCHTPWADSSYADAPTFNVKHGGLTVFGKTIIREMNRLGMMVDLSHVSTGTMRDALEVSEAPVIFSHSSAYELCNSSRNVQDDMLQSLAKNGGLVMVNFYSKFLSCSDNSTVHDAVAHINHIKRIAGIDHVGLGAGYDGINFTPKGLEDVSSYPTLFAELLGVGWSMEDLTKLAGGNFLRVMQQVERIRDEKKVAGVKPFEDHPNFRTDDPYNCTSS